MATFIFKYRSIGRHVWVDQCPDIDWCLALPDILRADGIAPPDPVPRKASSGSKRKLSDDEVEVVEDDRDEKELRALLVSIVIFCPGSCY